MEVKRGLKSSIPLPTLTYASETWTWNKAQHSRVHVVEIIYLKGASSITRWEGESKESMKDVVWELVQMESLGIVEWVKKMVWSHEEKEE